MGLSAQEILKTDPEFVQRQLQAQEMQRLNPSGSAAGAIGAVLGRGLGNVSRGQGFFETNNPGLQRVADVNNIMKSVQFDPKNPATYYEQIGTALQEAGYADLAPMAFQEARKFAPKREIRTVGNQVVDFSGAEPKVLFTGTEKEGKLANRLVELDTKLATQGLTEAEQAEKNALERVVRIQSPKGVTVDARQTQAKEVSKNKADLSAKLETDAVGADSQLANATAIGSVIDRSFTGFGADAVLKVGQIADALGVTVSGTTESEQLQQLLSKLAQGQARTLPGSLSEKELMFLREAIGTRGVTKETLRNVVKRIQQDAYTTIIANNKLQAYQSEGKDLNKFDFAKNTREARKLANLIEKASPEQRQQILGY
jgi:hypothetical protein